MLDLGQIRSGEVFCGRYRVDRLLKAGGMGAVYVAEHTATRKKVALKLMRPEIVANETARARFAQEAQASGIIESANIVDVYDAGVDPATQVPFIAMELLTGNELGELVKERGALPPEDVADYVAQTARALDRAHAAGVIHRDLKPDNLFLSLREGERPRVKILDFGIAKFVAGAAAETTRAAGTPLYMAPEQTRKGSNIGPHTDVWALGLIAYTLLVGRPYWEAEDLHELFGEIFGGDYESACARAERAGTRLPPSFDAWFFRCVAADPSVRFARAGEAASRLAEVLGVTQDLPPPSRLPQEPDEAPTRMLPVKSLTGNKRLADLAPPGWSGLPADLAPAPAPPAPPPPASSPALAPAFAPAPAPSSTPATMSTPGPVEQIVRPARPSTTPASTSPAPGAARPWLYALAVLGVAAAGAGVFFSLRARAVKAGHAAASAATAVSLGHADATCLLQASGGVRCAGARLGGKGNALIPEPLALGGPAAEIALGKHHGCARMQDGTVECWGEGHDGELGDGKGAAHAPAPVARLRGVSHVATGLHGACALLAGGRVACWGGNAYGQVGDGTQEGRLEPVDVAGVTGATSIALGQDHACALIDDGTARCWGRNTDGELGDGTSVNRSSPTPVVGLTDATALALGGHFTCALISNGTVRCWGSNADGALGHGTTNSRSTPLRVPGLDGVTLITAGFRHTCARLATGALRCWGQNTSGQLGDGTTAPRLVPTPVTAPGRFVQVDAGRAHTCGVRDDGVTVCWGRNEEGQLGDGTLVNRPVPAPGKW